MTDVERIEFDWAPPPREREIWCKWLRQHGIDPNQVVIPGWIERRPAAYQVAYLSVEIGPEGRPCWNREGGGGFIWTTRSVQLEGPPLPFPVAR